ncbi:MAG: hypothetical protein LBL07_00475, partial [Tannerella sp.]|nr:hypothetical protein [Tannerella sp.]
MGELIIEIHFGNDYSVGLAKQSDLAAETSERKAADTALQQSIASEATARQTKDNSLVTNLQILQKTASNYI